MTASSLQSYREQLSRLAWALALGQEGDIASALDDGFSLDHLKMFVDGNFEKRQELLKKCLEFLREAFDDLDDLLQDFVFEQPMVALESGTEDAERFLVWLEQTQDMTPEQHDFVACQRARHSIEAQARKNPRGHVYFQDLASVADQLAKDLEVNPALRIHLNPLRTWSRFMTSMLIGDDVSLPAVVMYFGSAKGVRTAILEAEGLDFINKLESLAPCSLAKWEKETSADRATLVALTRDLAAIGLIAFS